MTWKPSLLHSKVSKLNVPKAEMDQVKLAGRHFRAYHDYKLQF